MRNGLLVKAKFNALKAKKLKLNMAGGKPSKAQLDMVSDMLSILTEPKDCVSDGTDVCNYGELSGLPAAKRLFADILGCKPEECFIGGNASLTLMYDTVSKAYTHGMLHSEKPWCKPDEVMKEAGYTHKQIGEELGYNQEQIKQLVKRNRKKQKKQLTVQKQRGRPRKKPLSTEDEYQKRIEQLEMENELLRSFLQEIGRR